MLATGVLASNSRHCKPIIPKGHMAHAITWFEIPAADLKRARTFYENILGVQMQPMPSPERNMVAFPADWEQGDLAGCITQAPDMKPSESGTLLFLNCAPDLSVALGRVEAAGGRVLLPKTQIPMDNAGFMALILDTEGNRIGLHSPS